MKKKGESDMNFNNFTIKSQEAVQKAVDMAIRRSQQAIEPTHLLLGVMDVGESLIGYLFQKLGVNTVMLKSALDREVESLPKVSGGEPFLSRESNTALQKLWIILRNWVINLSRSKPL